MKRVLSLCVLVIVCSFGGQAQDVTQNGKQSSQTKNTQKINVFPNPATNVVNILGLINSDKADIMISDVYGNVMLKHQWRIKNNALNIPISTLDSGIHIITIRSQEQNVQTKFYKK